MRLLVQRSRMNSRMLMIWGKIGGQGSLFYDCGVY